MSALSCEQARRLLGASRRDDWTTQELEALGAHLRSCPDCRKVEAQYREVGEFVRLLPSTPPPVSFRARVFAAIAADQERIAEKATGRRVHAVPGRTAAASRSARPQVMPAAVSRLAGAETDPALAAVRPMTRPRSIPPRPIPWRVAASARANVRIVAGLAAMLLLALMGAALVPTSPFFLLGAPPSVAHYAADARVAHLGSVGASTGWLAYGGQDSGGQYLLLAQSRQGGKALSVVTGSASPVAVEAVAGNWVIWRATDGADWRLAATALPSGQTMSLLDSTATGPGAAVALHGVWASGNRVLAAATTRGGNRLVAQFDLSSGSPKASIILEVGGYDESFSLAYPSFDGQVYFWADVLHDANNGLQSSIWSGSDSAHARQVLDDNEAFHPQVTRGKLVWVSATTAPTTSGEEIDAGLAAAVGSVRERDLSSGDQRQIGTNATASSLEAAGGLVIWQSSGTWHTYDVEAGGPSRVDGQVRGAGVVGLSDTALVWAQPGSTTLNVYNVG